VFRIAAGLSFAILVIFGIEIALRIARNPRKYFKSRFNKIDFVVVYTSLGMEIALMAIPKSHYCTEDDVDDHADDHRLLTVLIHSISKFE